MPLATRQDQDGTNSPGQMRSRRCPGVKTLAQALRAVAGGCLPGG